MYPFEIPENIRVHQLGQFMLALIKFAMGPVGKIIGMAVIAFGLIGTVGVWMHNHDNGVRAEMQDKNDKAISAERERAAKHEIEALQASAIDTQQRLTRIATIREQTHAVPTTSSCTGSPAIRAMLDGLRENTGGSSTGVSGSSRTDAMRASTSDTSKHKH